MLFNQLIILMLKLKTSVVGLIAGVAISLGVLSLGATAYAASLTSAQTSAILSLLSSFGASSATIANVNSALNGTSVTTTTTTNPSSFTRDLTIGSKGDDVVALQTSLIAGGYSIPAGATGYFGAQTQAAVSAWQKAVGVSPTAGYFGAKSRAVFGGVSSSTTTTTSTTSTTTPVIGGVVKVGLSASSPNNSVLVVGQGIGILGQFTFTNTTASPVNVTGLSFKRTGVSNDSTIDNVYLYNGVTRLTDSAGISSGAFSFSDANALFTIPANSSYVVSVRADIDNNADASGQQVGVQLTGVTSPTTLDSSVQFPISSGYQTISAATMARVTFDANVSPSGSTFVSPQTSYPIWQDTVEVDKDTNLTSLKFTNLGSIDSSNVQNVRLYVDGTQVGGALSKISADRTVVFDLSSSPVLLNDQAHTIKVLADITGGAGRTLQLSIQRSSDVMLVDNQLNQPVRPTFSGTASSGVVTINSVGGSSSTQGVSVSTDPASPSSDVAKNASNVKLASFDFLASGENVKISDLFVTSNTPLENGKIRVNGVQIGSSHNIASSTVGTDFGLGSSLVLQAGVSTRVDIYADTRNISNSSVIVGLAAGSANAQGLSSLNNVDVPGIAVNGNQVNLSASSLMASAASGYGSQAIVPGTNNAKLGEFNLSTGSTEGVTVNTIALSLASSTEVTNLTLKDSTGNQIGTVITTPNDSSNSFNVSLNIPASSTKTIGVYGNILSNAVLSSVIKATVLTTTTGVGNTTGTSASVASATGLQNITVGTGSISAAVGAGDPYSAIVVAGSSSVNVGQFTFYAINSTYSVQNLDVQINSGTGADITTASLVDASGNVIATQSVSGNVAQFRGLSINVPSNDQTDISVTVGIPTTASGARSGDVLSAKLLAANFRAVDASGKSGATISDTTAGGVFTIRKSVPTFAIKSVSSNTPNNPLYQFTITADKAGQVNWSKLSFDVATTSASGQVTTVSNLYLTDESGSLIAGTNGSVVNGVYVASPTSAQQIASGATKTYNLYGTVSGFTTGSTVTIDIVQDTSSSTNIQWSDRSATGNINGYLVKNLTTTSVNYSR